MTSTPVGDQSRITWNASSEGNCGPITADG